ncbi:hypothetical protein CBR_g46429 [Chara braunii]|uniref:Cyclin n=1 Tax=Chara braunii TaxID=69332 RepID=A0A388M0G0_CHABU|nr:hypothetical protein CBR_g46429 [Chara braunii]|eukprot:GBG88060.1 hypothetical protein CBR_g46429 [Chara braunii]
MGGTDYVVGMAKKSIFSDGGSRRDPCVILEIDSESSMVERPRVLSVLATLLERLVARNERHVMTTATTPYASPCRGKLTVFHGLRAPSITIDKYLERIFKYANCSPACFVVAYVYIDRLIQRQPELPITSLNVHRLLVTAVMVAAKFLDDVYFNNGYYAKVGGVTTAEMNRLELEFLFRLDFRLHVTTGVFEHYSSHLEKELILSGGHKMDRPLMSPLRPSLEPSATDLKVSKAKTLGRVSGMIKSVNGAQQCRDGSGGWERLCAEVWEGKNIEEEEEEKGEEEKEEEERRREGDIVSGIKKAKRKKKTAWKGERGGVVVEEEEEEEEKGEEEEEERRREGDLVSGIKKGK